MIKRVCFSLLAATTAVSASPLVLWKRNVEQSAALSHSSSDVKSSEIIGEVLRSSPSSSASLAGVIFLLGRGQDGSETLSRFASQGALPGVAVKCDEAVLMHHHASGIDTAHTIVRNVEQANKNLRVVSVSLSEYSSKLENLGKNTEEVELTVSGPVTSKIEGKRARALANADVLVVKVDANVDPAGIDSVIVSAIEHENIANVILTAVRSHEEVKLERAMINQRRLEKQREAGRHLYSNSQNRRRLDQGDDAAGDDANKNNQDLTGIYYVSMTPNILAGILFFFMFCVITYIAVGCMNMITGQDVYVSKLPSIGREA